MKNVKGSGGEAPKGLARPAPTIPHWVTESLQWAHSLMMVRWLVMYVVVDGWVRSTHHSCPHSLLLVPHAPWQTDLPGLSQLYASVYCGAASLIGMLIFSRYDLGEATFMQALILLYKHYHR